MYISNQSGMVYNEYEIPQTESTYKCYLNPLFSHEDLTDHFVASLAVISEQQGIRKASSAQNAVTNASLLITVQE
ncbi:hypothetical protein RB195_024243 [Necator americanus]|uniref:Uncharacterized protein n=1 Tax=Necator americanus TaxID=51031 RepID=A0ABR1EML5_NECAM